jgi:uracil phosphoribosyltransferase
MQRFAANTTTLNRDVARKVVIIVTNVVTCGDTVFEVVTRVVIEQGEVVIDDVAAVAEQQVVTRVVIGFPQVRWGA